MAERQATAVLKWIVDDSDVAASWAKIRAQAEQGLGIKLNSVPTAAGSPTGTPTLGGLMAGSGTLPAGLATAGGAGLQLAQLGQQIAQSVGQAVRAAQFSSGPDFQGMAADRWIANAENIEAGGRAIGVPSFAETPTGRQARRGGFGLRLFGASLFAAHGMTSLWDAQVEEDEIGDMMGRGDNAGALQARLTQARSARRGFGGMIRAAAGVPAVQSFIATAAGMVSPLSGKVFAAAMPMVAQQLDPKAQEEESLRGLATIQFSDESDDILSRSRRLQRQTAAINADPVARAALEGQQRLDDARKAMRPTNATAALLRSLGLRDASNSLRRFVGSYMDSEGAFAAARNADAERITNEEGSDLISQTDIANDRAGFRPLAAGRRSLGLQHTRALRDLDRTHSILAPFARILFNAQDTALGAEQARDVERSRIGEVSEGSELLMQLARRPLDARLSAINGEAQDRLASLSRDPENDPTRAQILRNRRMREQLAIQEDEQHRGLLSAQITSRGVQLAALIRHDPIGAQVEGIVAGGIEQATILRNAGLGQFSVQALQNTRSQLELTRQNFLESFHATEIGQNFDTSSPRGQASMEQMLRDLVDAANKIETAIKAATSAK